jgi:hypothetical protein
MNLLLEHHAPAVFGHAFTGAFTRRRHAALRSSGPLMAPIGSGRDLAWAIGDISGAYHVHRDASAVTYGDFSADITADRDVTTALNPTGLTGGGHQPRPYISPDQSPISGASTTRKPTVIM